MYEYTYARTTNFHFRNTENWRPTESNIDDTNEDEEAEEKTHAHTRALHSNQKVENWRRIQPKQRK